MPRSKYKKRADGRYLVQLKNGRKPDGSIRYKNIYGRTEPEVDRKILEFRNQQKKVGVVLTEKDTLTELADTWLKSKFPKGSESDNEYNTYLMYSNAIENHIKPSAVAHERAANVRTDDLQDIISKIVKDGHARTAGIVKSTLIQIFNLGVDWNKLLFNPAEKIILKRHKAAQKRTTTELEETAVLSADLTSRERAFIYLELFAGLRRGESLALTFRGNKPDVDLTHNTVCVNKGLIFKQNTGVVKPLPKTDASNRVNPIITPLRSVLSIFINSTSHISNYLFETQQGELMTRSAYRKLWESILKKLNLAVGTEAEPESITDLSSHILRHTFATYLAVHGVNPQTVQRLLGHASIQMTMDVYTHLPLYHRYEKSPMYYLYRDFLVSQKSVKTLNRKIKTISRNKKKPLV